MAGNTDRSNTNYTTTVLAKSSAGDNADVIIWGDPLTHRLYCDVVISSAIVVGTKSNNAVVPGTNNLGVLPAVANAAAPTYTETFQTALSVDLSGNLRVGGTGATAAAVPASGVYNGAQARSSEISAATNGNLVGLVADLVGKLIVLPYANPENFVSGAITSAMTGTTSTSLIAAPGAGRNYITQITVSNSHATQGTDVIIQDGNGGTTLYTIPAAAVYGGAVVVFPTPLRQPTVTTAIYCANVTTGASTKVSASGYKGV